MSLPSFESTNNPKAVLFIPRTLPGYEDTKEVEYLPPLLSKVVHSCMQTGCKTLIADLVNEHCGYEDVYRSLGFEKSAEWAIYEKEL